MTRHLSKIRPWLVVLLLCSMYLLVIFIVNGSNPLVFATLGTQFTGGEPTGTEGYDGKFTYFIATDPFTAPDLIDVPAYRYQRILLPALARLLALGSTALAPWTLLLINLAALAVSTALLEDLLRQAGISRWYALTYGLFVGVFMSVRLSLNEPLAYGLVILSIWLERRGRLWPAAGVMALAALSKETTLLFAAGYLLWLLTEKRWRVLIGYGAVVGLPFAAWQGVLFSQFGAFGVGSGGALATSFEIIPFNGFLRIFTDTGSLSVFLVFAVLLLPSTILPALWALWDTLHNLRGPHSTPYTWLLLMQAAIMPFVPFSTYREPLGILRFIVGLVIGLVLYSAAQHKQRALRYSTLWCLLLMLAVSSG